MMPRTPDEADRIRRGLAAIAALEEALGADTLQPGDRDLLLWIHKRVGAAQSSAQRVECARLIRTYYQDADRADRTPRAFLYFHLGLLGGYAER